MYMLSSTFVQMRRPSLREVRNLDQQQVSGCSDTFLTGEPTNSITLPTFLQNLYLQSTYPALNSHAHHNYACSMLVSTLQMRLRELGQLVLITQQVNGETKA